MYHGVAKLSAKLDPAAIFEDLFARNGWQKSWRNGIYNYVHYHSGIHRFLGVARGSAKVQFGGKRGRSLMMKAGECLYAEDDFLVVGAYPLDGIYPARQLNSPP